MTGTQNSRLGAFSRTVRLPLTLLVALTALAGAIGHGGADRLTLWALGWGVLLLGAASSVLNQVRERAGDALLTRTCGRPLACGALAPRSGTTLGLLLAGGGTATLAAGTGSAVTLLGLGALAWYLLVYTPLKRLTPLAVLAGTPCGAVPPLMGWLAAGGTLPAPQPLALALFMLLWQVPHFWLLALPERDELAAAGYRVLPPCSERRLLALCHRWLLSLALVALLLPLLGLPAHPFAQGLTVAGALLLAGGSSWLLGRPLFPTQTARRLRALLYLALLLLLAALFIDPLLF